MRKAFFPLAVALLPWLSYLLHQRGLPVGLAVSGPLIALLLGVLALERVWAHDPGWNENHGDLRADLGFAAIVRAPDMLASALGHALAAALASLSPRVSTLPLAAQFFGVLLAADFGKYLMHRLSHHHPTLWRFHAVHHAAERLYVLNGLRIHPVNLLWYAAFDVTLPLVLGIDPRVLVVLATLRGVVSIVQHANLRLAFGPLGYVFSTNELHRFHHSAILEESRSNYGSTFIVWDLLFGSYRSGGAPRAVGLGEHAPLPRSLLGQLLWPFCGRCGAHFG